MVQQRIYNFGDVLTQGRTKALTSRLMAAGVYEGMDPVITSSASLKLTPGAFLLPNGVMVIETADVTEVEYPPSWPPVSPADFSLVAEHDDIQAYGGSAVVYSLRPGLLPPATDSGTTICWLRHAGSAPLNPGMVSIPPKLKNADSLRHSLQEFGWLQAPFADMGEVVSGSNVQQVKGVHISGPHHAGLKIVNSSTTTAQNFQFMLPLPRIPWARRIEVFADIPTSASIGFNLSSTNMTAPAVASVNSVLTVSSTAWLSTGDKFVVTDPSGKQEVTKALAVPSGTAIQAALTQNFAAGSILTSLSRVYDDRGAALTVMPSVVNGPVLGLDTPAAVFQIGPGGRPASLGIKVLIPPQRTVFFKGIQLVGD